MIRVAINGFGRIGRSFARCWLGRENSQLELVAINDTSDPRSNAHLLRYDSMMGTLKNVDISADENSITLNGKTVKCVSDRNPLNLPWKDWGIDLIIEAAGVFVDQAGASKHITAGAKKVLITAPGKGSEVGTYVMGVNHHNYKHSDYTVISNASCTTNCLAPVLKVLHENFGIVKGMMTTTHSYTGDQRLLDASHRDLRRPGGSNEYCADFYRSSPSCGFGDSGIEGQVKWYCHARADSQCVRSRFCGSGREKDFYRASKSSVQRSCLWLHERDFGVQRFAFSFMRLSRK